MMNTTKRTTQIPEIYQIKETIQQSTYLVGGQLKPWNGDTADVYSTISSTEEYQKTFKKQMAIQ